MERKTCRLCKESKSLAEFSRHMRAKDGYQSYCKECNRLDSAKYRSDNHAKLRDANRLYRASHKEELRIYWRRYGETHREEIVKCKAAARKTGKGKARMKLGKAVYLGRIAKPSHCSSCGREVKRRLLHGHHGDYLRPLDVTWLCPQCHGLVHRTG